MVVKQLIEGYPKEKRTAREDGSSKLRIAEMFYDTIQGENFTGVPATFMRMQGCTLNCVWCFHENTKIQTAFNGKKKIKDIKQNDILLTLDKKNNIVETQVKKIMKRKVNIKDNIIKLILNNKKDTPLVVTKEHPIYVKDKGWTKAKYIEKNDIIIGIESTQLVSYKMKKNNPMKKLEIREKCKTTQKYLRQIGIMKPYERTEKHRLVQRSYKLGEKNPMKNPETVRKNALSHFKKKSSLETKYEQLFNELNLPITYIGNNKLAIGNKKLGYRFPDFLIDGKKKLIEVYDTTFPWYANYGKREKGTYERDRINHYKKCGYKVIFLTENDLKNKQTLQEKLFTYIFNGYVVTDITDKISRKSYAQLFGNLNQTETKVFNLSCYPYNTYLANNLWVHNCDTVEVWRQGNPYSVDELIEMCEEKGLINRWREGQHLILTGGSPLIQQKALVEFIHKIRETYGFKPYIEIENECVLEPSKDMLSLVDLWNNSPKLSNSCNPSTLMYKPDVLKLLNNLDNSWFKFVITSLDDWEEIKEKFIEPGLISKEKIVLMPEGVTREELQQHYDIVVKLAVEENIRMTDRLHVTIWNKKTGV